MTKLLLDAGHGGHDPGATGHGYREKDFVLQICRRIKQIFDTEYNGITVRLTRSDDRFISLGERSRIARSWGADVFISVHMNAFNGRTGGIETFKHRSSSASRSLQQNLQSHMLQELRKLGNTPNRGNKDAGFAVLSGTYKHMLSCLTEVLFIDSPGDSKIFKQNTFVERAARAHVLGVIATRSGITRKPNASASKPAPSTSSNSWMDHTGQAVTDLQNKLLQAGEKLPRFGVDGHFGSETLQAVQSFQSKNGISNPNGNHYGVPGPQTMRALDQAATKPSYVGKGVRSTYDGRLNFYRSKTWSNPAGSVTKGYGFPTIVAKHKVGKGEQYEVKNSNGQTFYITASSKYVRVVG
ncbi:N-acetylmuramoyl-L-alanine amidase [Sinobaca sp. H24]|uniref:N-acetylmuramoyl-L-alanine amidase n=1 Tax=Sinobaca sp. H24 TaxID=2923376 RepID=UPI00237AE8AE|nr:N-acetylmuramoyl-L-alanine amidase [Sinobaca sp. H24]